MNELVVVKSNAELDAMELSEQEQELSPDQELFSSELARLIHDQWVVNRDERESSGVTEQLINCLRAKKGEYTPEKLAEIKLHGGSEIKMQITGGQSQNALAWMTDILLSSGQRIFGLESGSEPNVPESLAESLRSEMYSVIQQSQQQGQPLSEEEQIKKAIEIDERVRGQIKVKSSESLEQAEDKIADQFEEGGFYEALEEFLEDFVTFKTAFIEGPIYRRKPKLSWEFGQMQAVDDIIPTDERVSPFDVYPSPGAKVIDDGRLIIRKKFSRSSLHQCLGLKGFNKEAVEDVLHEFNSYDGWLDNNIEQDRESLEQRATGSTETSTVDAIQFYGDVDGLTLLEWGVPTQYIDDPLKVYEVDAILIGRHVIKCDINDDPLVRRPLQKASMYNIPGSFWGIALAEKIEDIQQICDGTARSIQNNVAMCSGPQVALFEDMLSAGADTSMFPWKTWSFDSEITKNQIPVTFFQPQSHVNELMSVYEYFESKAFQVTGIPKHGAIDARVGGGHGSSAGVASLLDADAKGVKNSVRHIDTGVIKRRVLRQFTDNMLSGESGDFTGDVRPVAKGAVAVAIKGAQEIRQAEFLQMTSNPTDMEIIGVEGRAELLRERAEGLGWRGLKIVPDEDALKEKMANKQQQPNVEALKMQIEQAKLEESKLDRESKERISELENKSRELVATLSNQERMAELALREDITVAQLQAKLEIENKKLLQKDKAQSVDLLNKRQLKADEVKEKMHFSPGYFAG